MKLKPREQLLLVGLGVVLLMLLARAFMGSAETEPVTEESTRNARAAVTAAIDGGEDAPVRQTSRTRVRQSTNAAPGEVLALRIDALEAAPGEFSPGRNPWRYAPRKVTRAAPPRPQPAPQTRPQPRVEKPPEGPTEAPKPKPPAIDLRYLGSFGPQSAPIAVFSDPDEVLYNAPLGSVVKEEFTVREVGFESVSVGWVRFPDEEPQRLAVGGK